MKQVVLGDGSCLFRSAACCFVHALTGLNCGPGTRRGHERTERDYVANAVAMWLRCLVSRSLLYKNQSVADAAGGRLRSFYTVLLADILPVWPAWCTAAARKGAFVRRPPSDAFRGWPPPLPKNTLKRTQNARLPCGLHLANLVDLAEFGSVDHYARHVANEGTWGGESELYLLAACVLHLTVEVYDARTTTRLFIYEPPAGHTAHRLKLLYHGYTGRKHYDAFLPELPQGKTLLDLLK